jgi:hypothetical protein
MQDHPRHLVGVPGREVQRKHLGVLLRDQVEAALREDERVEGDPVARDLGQDMGTQRVQAVELTAESRIIRHLLFDRGEGTSM